jgi:hypothetical protein
MLDFTGADLNAGAENGLLSGGERTFIKTG